MLKPGTTQELAEVMRMAGAARRTVTLGGCFSKQQMAGPVEPSDTTISTSMLRRVLQYEPQDLTISVEAGLPWRDLTSLLAANRQMIPLDPPFFETATVGGVVAANCSGPRRRLYGTARDCIIGMKFVTLDGRIVQSGGMVVKNVAGLDMGKLMIGSFGTLAAIAVVNFKVFPIPLHERSFLLAFETLADAMAARDAILKSVLQPAALDLLSPQVGAHLGPAKYVLAVQAGGNARAVERYEREISLLGEGVVLEGTQEASLWRYVQGYTSRYLSLEPDGAVVRVSCTLKELRSVVESFPGPVIARAGSGVCYGYFPKAVEAGGWVRQAAARGWKAVVEFAPENQKHAFDLWPSPGNDFEVMKRIKRMFDPDQLLNRGRLYRHI